MLSSKYSVEEMGLLDSIVYKCEKEDPEWLKKDALNIYREYGIRRVAHLDDEPTMLEPMDNMPLYINDSDVKKKAMAIFRLQVGR